MKTKTKFDNSNQLQDFIFELTNSKIGFWIDSSGGPEKYSTKSFYGINPKYYFYGSLNEVNLCNFSSNSINSYQINFFDFLEDKITEEKENKDGIFVGYFSYDLSNIFFAYFEEYKTLDCIDSPIESLHLNLPNSLLSNMTDEEYLNKVIQIKNEIKEGNVYQVNLTRKYFLENINLSDEEKINLYLTLRNESPVPYGCYFRNPFLTMLSNSPEEFIFVEPKLNDRYIRTRPIKGTLPSSESTVDFKNQAENIMIVDLERNDLGRICEYGSVKVSKLLELEKYKNLNHVVSTIEGKLKENIAMKNIFEALFPGGSITGAPKIAAMKIINELEPTSRELYTGSFGYIKNNGIMNFNILIRTIFIKENLISFNVGGGIIADSIPENELEEIKLKAQGIIKTLGVRI